MKRFSKFMALFILACTLISISLPVNAARAHEMEDCGFHVPTTGYNYEIWNEDDIVLTGFYLGRVMGRTTITVARARSKTSDSHGKYYDTIFVRSQMNPKSQRWNGETRWAMNAGNEIYMKLNPNQSFVNYAPDSTMPESSSTWNVSVGGGYSGNGWGLTIDTGYTSTTRDNCFTVSTNCDAEEGKYDVIYNYKSYDNFFGTAARRATNLWCTRSHKCYCMFKYQTPNDNTNLMKVVFSSRFRLATTFGSTWNGGTWNVTNAYTYYNAAEVTFPNSN